MGHLYTRRVILAISAIGTLTIATIYLPLIAAHSNENVHSRRLEGTNGLSLSVKDEERMPLPFKVAETVAEDVESLIKPLSITIREFPKNESPFLKFNKLNEYIEHERAALSKDVQRPLQTIARTVAVHFGDDKLSRWIEEAKQIPEQQALANELEAGLFMQWSSTSKRTEDVFKMLKLNFVFEDEVKHTTPDMLFENSGLDILIGYASKLYEAKTDMVDMADIAGAERKYEREGQKDVVAVLQDHFYMKELLYMIEETIKRPKPRVSVVKIEAGLVDYWMSVENLTVERLFHYLKLEKDITLAGHPLMSLVVMYAAKQSCEFDLIKLWDGHFFHKLDRLQEILDEAKATAYSKIWAKEVEKWLLDYLEQKKMSRSFSRPTHYNRASSPPAELIPNAPLMNANVEPIPSRDAQSTAEAFMVRPSSASTPLHAPLPNLKQKQVKSFIDDLNPQVEHETEINVALSTQRGKIVKKTRKQAMVLDEVVTPPADPKPISSSLNELSPALTLHRDAKKNKASLIDEQIPPAKLKINLDSAISPLRHKQPTDREQPLISKEARPPADPKPISASRDKVSPASVPHRDAKEHTPSLIDYRNPPVHLKTNPDSALPPVRHELSLNREHPMMSSEVVTPPADPKPISSSFDELIPASMPRRDTKKDRTSLIDDRNPPAKLETTALTPLRDEIPPNREQLLMSSQVVTPPADPKPISSSLDELSLVATPRRDTKKDGTSLIDDRNPPAEPETTALSPLRDEVPPNRDQPLMSSEVVTPPADPKPISSSLDELSPVATPRRDAKKDGTSLIDDRNPPAKLETTALSPLRDELPPNREQLLMSSEVVTPPADPKPISSSLDELSPAATPRRDAKKDGTLLIDDRNPPAEPETTALSPLRDEVPPKRDQPLMSSEVVTPPADPKPISSSLDELHPVARPRRDTKKDRTSLIDDRNPPAKLETTALSPLRDELPPKRDQPLMSSEVVTPPADPKPISSSLDELSPVATPRRDAKKDETSLIDDRNPPAEPETTALSPLRDEGPPNRDQPLMSSEVVTPPADPKPISSSLDELIPASTPRRDTKKDRTSLIDDRNPPANLETTALSPLRDELPPNREQLLMSSEVVTPPADPKPISSSLDELSPVATPRRDAKKDGTSLIDDRNRPAEPETIALSPLRDEVPPKRDQPLMSSEVVTPPADPKPISSSLDELSPAATPRRDAKKDGTFLIDDRNPPAEPETTALSPLRDEVPPNRDQPLMSSEVVTPPADPKPISSSLDELSPVATPRRDAKKDGTSLIDDRNRPAEPETTAMSPLRDEGPPKRDQPLMSSEVVTPPADPKPISSSLDELSPVATPRRDAKKDGTSLIDDRNPPAEPETTALSPLRDEVPPNRDQPLMSSEVVTPPADPKPISSSFDKLIPASTPRRDTKKDKTSLIDDRNRPAELETTAMSPLRDEVPPNRDQPLMSSEVVTPPADPKPISSFLDELSPVATPRRDTKKDRTSLIDDRNPPAKLETTALSPLRDELPPNREQLLMSSEVVTPPADPKPISSSLDELSPVATPRRDAKKDGTLLIDDRNPPAEPKTIALSPLRDEVPPKRDQPLMSSEVVTPPADPKPISSSLDELHPVATPRRDTKKDGTSLIDDRNPPAKLETTALSPLRDEVPPNRGQPLMSSEVVTPPADPKPISSSLDELSPVATPRRDAKKDGTLLIDDRNPPAEPKTIALSPLRDEVPPKRDQPLMSSEVVTPPADPKPISSSLDELHPVATPRRDTKKDGTSLIDDRNPPAKLETTALSPLRDEVPPNRGQPLMSSEVVTPPADPKPISSSLDELSPVATPRRDAKKDGTLLIDDRNPPAEPKTIALSPLRDEVPPNRDQPLMSSEVVTPPADPKPISSFLDELSPVATPRRDTKKDRTSLIDDRNPPAKLETTALSPLRDELPPNREQLLMSSEVVTPPADPKPISSSLDELSPVATPRRDAKKDGTLLIDDRNPPAEPKTIALSPLRDEVPPKRDQPLMSSEVVTPPADPKPISSSLDELHPVATPRRDTKKDGTSLIDDRNPPAKLETTALSPLRDEVPPNRGQPLMSSEVVTPPADPKPISSSLDELSPVATPRRDAKKDGTLLIDDRNPPAEPKTIALSPLRDEVPPKRDQPLMSSEVVTPPADPKPISSSLDELHPVATPRRDTKKDGTSLIDDRNPPAKLETTALSPLRDELPPNREQLLMSSEVVTPPADPKPISSSLDELSPAATPRRDAKKDGTFLIDDRNPPAEPETTALSPLRDEVPPNRDQPLMSSEVVTPPADPKPISSSFDKLIPASTPRRDTKKDKTSLIDDRNRPAEPETTALSPLRDEVPPNRDQPLMSSKVVTPPADPKPISSSLDELIPASTPRRDAKKDGTFLIDDRNSPAELETTALSPLRDEVPPNRDQPLMSSEVVTPPADPKPISSSLDELSPASTPRRDAKKDGTSLIDDRNSPAELETTALSSLRDEVPPNREQPLMSSEVVTPPADPKPISSSLDELNPVATPRRDAKKDGMSLIDDRNPPAELETKFDSALPPLRHELPSTREQPLMPSKAESSPADPKPTPSSPNASRSRSRLARFRRWLSALWAKLRALLWPSSWTG